MEVRNTSVFWTGLVIREASTRKRMIDPEDNAAVDAYNLEYCRLAVSLGIDLFEQEWMTFQQAADYLDVKVGTVVRGTYASNSYMGLDLFKVNNRAHVGIGSVVEYKMTRQYQRHK
jgi:hypothetical protein